MITKETKQAVDIILNHTETTEDFNSIIDAVNKKRRLISKNASKKFNVGDKVHWISKRRGGGCRHGIITRINRISATVEIGPMEQWKVPFSILRQGEYS